MADQPAWVMARDTLEQMGGKTKSFKMVDIVNKLYEHNPNIQIKKSTVDHQISRFCVNCHPTHDQFPDHGKSWKKNPLFIKEDTGLYRLFDPETDNEIYTFEVMRDTRNYKSKAEEEKTIIIKPIEFENEETEFQMDVINFLEICGEKLGFFPQREWSVPMGKIDLVWLKKIDCILPGMDTDLLPVVGFELETSWRTRKHIKGDIMNLLNLNAPIGVIIQQTSREDDPEKVKSLIKNIDDLVFTKNYPVLVWTDKDLVVLAKILKI